MRTIFGIALVLGLAEAVFPASIEEILSYRSLDEVELSPDGKHAVFVATTANFESNVLDSNVWLAELATGEHFALTSSPGEDFHPRWSPDGSTVAFLSDRGGEVGVWQIEIRGGEASPLFEGDGEITAFEWLPDASGLVLTRIDPETEEDRLREETGEDWIEADRDHEFARLFRFRFEHGELERLGREDEHVSGFDVAPSAAARPWVVASVQPTPKVPDGRLHSNLAIFDLESGERRDLVRQPGLDLDPRFSPDGSLIAFVSMGGKADWIGNYYVGIVRPDGSGLRHVSRGAIDERVRTPLRWSRDGREISALAGQGTAQRIFTVDVDRATAITPHDFDAARVVTSFDVGRGGETVLAASDAHTPAEIYRVAGSTVSKVTSVNGDYDASQVGRTEILSYESEDGVALEGLVVRPVGFEEGRTYPLLVVIHGGPSGAFTVAFSPRRGVYPLHAFSEEGYLVFMPNPRGSGGYGEDFRRSNFRDWGYGDFQDIMTGVDVLIEKGLADPERMGVMGWSYGGFMTSWVVTHTDRFRAASIGAPVTNPYSFYGTTDIPDFIDAYFGGKPWEEGTNYLRHAPEHFAENAKTPSLMQHGEEDVRVPLSQGDAFYRALEKNGVEVQMFVYPREPHGLREPKHIRHALETNLEWFRRFVPAEAGQTE